MASISPNRDKLREVLETAKGVSPLVMINLLRFRTEANYGPDSEHVPCSGREAFQRYGEVVRPLLANVGARAIWSGSVLSSLIAPDGECWDHATLIQYPSIDALMTMSGADEYHRASVHRTAALSDSRLIVTNPESRQ